MATTGSELSRPINEPSLQLPTRSRGIGGDQVVSVPARTRGSGTRTGCRSRGQRGPFFVAIEQLPVGRRRIVPCLYFAERLARSEGERMSEPRHSNYLSFVVIGRPTRSTPCPYPPAFGIMAR